MNLSSLSNSVRRYDGPKHSIRVGNLKISPKSWVNFKAPMLSCDLHKSVAQDFIFFQLTRLVSISKSHRPHFDAQERELHKMLNNLANLICGNFGFLYTFAYIILGNDSRSADKLK
jgi:hypothetical protein